MILREGARSQDGCAPLPLRLLSSSEFNQLFLLT